MSDQPNAPATPAQPPDDTLSKPLVRKAFTPVTSIAGVVANSNNLLPVFSEGGVDQLIAAMTNVMAEIRHIPKRGHNKHDNYRYVQWNDVATRLQDAQFVNSLVIGQRELSRNIVDGVLFITCAFDVLHGSGQYAFNLQISTGSCRFKFAKGTTDDKASFKANTSAVKAAMIALFRIPAEDGDVERDDIEELMERRRNSREGTDERIDRDEPRDRGRDDRGPPPRDDRYDDRGRGDDRDRRDERGRPRDDGPDYRYGDTDRGRDRDDSRRSRDDDRRGPPPGDRRPPPAEPFDGGAPPSDEWTGGAARAPDTRASKADEDEARELIRQVRTARDVNEADGFWRDHGRLLKACSDGAYEHLRGIYMQKWIE